MKPVDYMSQALELAQLAKGYTSPNPAVGCVIVKEGRVVGTGYHRKAGTPHAEVWALKEAGDDATGSTVYVTLEPCAHYGKTPPCANTLIERKVAKVVIAMADPNPLVAGKGAEKLRQAGIEVEIGLLSKEAAQLNEDFIKWMLIGKPFITAKVAMSLDGRTATRTGSSQWITNDRARKYGHYLRSIHDGILVGIQTVLADNPLLTCRVPRAGNDIIHQPTRIVLDSSGQIPLTAKLIADKTAKTIVITTDASSEEKRLQLEQAGILILMAKRSAQGIDLQDALQQLSNIGIHSILVEGGAAVHGSFFDNRLVDKLYFFIGSMVIGGQDAVPAIGGMGANLLSQTMPLCYDKIELLENNLLITAYNERREGAYVHWNH